MELLILLRFLTDHEVVIQNLMTSGITPKKKKVPEIEERLQPSVLFLPPWQPDNPSDLLA